MERIRSDAFLRAAKEAVASEHPESKDLENDEVIFRAALEKATSRELDQIDMDEFADMYGEGVVAQDKEAVARLEERFAAQTQNPEYSEQIKLCKILEAIIIEQIELNNWLGGNVNTQQTTRFDDIFNGIDFLAEFNENDFFKYVGFAVDVTFGKTKTIKMKLEKIRSEIHHGELGRLKYFQTSEISNENVIGQKRMLPKIILALDKQTVIELAKLWVRGEQKTLSEHHVRQYFFREVMTQLRGQLMYVQALKREGKLDGDTSDRLIKILSSQIAASVRSQPDTTDETGGQNLASDRINSLVKSVFDESNVHRIQELEDKLKIKKKMKRRGKKL